MMDDLQRNPLKVYIQDIYRAQRHPENKYIYQLFGLSFKNVMVQGVVTAIYNKTATTANIELSDPTATVNLYFDSTKNNHNISTETMKMLCSDFADAKRCGDERVRVMDKMMKQLMYNKQNPISFPVGSYITVIGDIFVDDLKGVRMVSAYECKPTTVDAHVVWLEELRWLYEKFYLWTKE